MIFVITLTSVECWNDNRPSVVTIHTLRPTSELTESTGNRISQQLLGDRADVRAKVTSENAVRQACVRDAASSEAEISRADPVADFHMAVLTHTLKWERTSERAPIAFVQDIDVDMHSAICQTSQSLHYNRDFQTVHVPQIMHYATRR